VKAGPEAERIRPDCRFYRGLKPCGRGEDCAGCTFFEPLGSRILIIKLGALGDVLRTTPLLRGLKKESPRAEVVWLTDPASAQLLTGNPLLDQVWTTGAQSLARLLVERFDRVICLDKEPEAIAAASLARAPVKQGFGMNDRGRLIPLNPAAVENLRLGLSDELKFRQNRKSYQRLVFETAELAFFRDYDYLYHLPAEDEDWARAYLAGRLDPGADLLIGFNLGGADLFAHKRWKEDHFLKLRELIAERWGSRAAVLGLGGPEDQDRLAGMEELSQGAILNTGLNPMARFAALLKACRVVVTGDSLAMHLALAVGTWCLVLMGSTTPREIELYGRGEILVSDLDCAPCYQRTCQRVPDCMDLFTPERVMDRLAALIQEQGGA